MNKIVLFVTLLLFLCNYFVHDHVKNEITFILYHCKLLSLLFFFRSADKMASNLIDLDSGDELTITSCQEGNDNDNIDTLQQHELPETSTPPKSSSSSNPQVSSTTNQNVHIQNSNQTPTKNQVKSKNHFSHQQFSQISTDYEFENATSACSASDSINQFAENISETRSSSSSSTETLTDNENSHLIHVTKSKNKSNFKKRIKNHHAKKEKGDPLSIGNIGACGKIIGHTTMDLIQSPKNILKKTLSPHKKQIIKNQPSKYSYVSVPDGEQQAQNDDNNNNGLDFDQEDRVKTNEKLPSNYQNMEVNLRRRRTRITDHPDDEIYVQMVRLARRTIDERILPELIAQGSSGSYFVKGAFREYETLTNNNSATTNKTSSNLTDQNISSKRIVKTIAVFKPKNEEPYAVLNPKWTKWVQRNFCFCCFGRNCLIQNQGFTSECAASAVDKHFGINLVPLRMICKIIVYLFIYSFSYLLENFKYQIRKRPLNITFTSKRCIFIITHHSNRLI